MHRFRYVLAAIQQLESVDLLAQADPLVRLDAQNRFRSPFSRFVLTAKLAVQPLRSARSIRFWTLHPPRSFRSIQHTNTTFSIAQTPRPASGRSLQVPLSKSPR